MSKQPAQQQQNAGPAKFAEDDEAQFQDENYKGEKLPIAISKNGPPKESKFTDVFCCLFFILYVAGMIAVIIMNSANSDVKAMRDISDSEGNICGKSNGFENLPKLLMFKFTAPFHSVCVKECPKFDYN